jgi:solute carrier family 25 (mitochondrial phosphate transporter), member 23/24/25/41
MSDEKFKNLGFGAIAGVVSRTMVAPLERMKILYQIQSSKYNGTIINNFQHIYKQEGFRGLYSGNATNCARVVPKTAIQYMAFRWINEYTENKYLSGGLSGLATTVSVYPLETIRSVLSVQDLSKPGAHRSIYSCGKHIVKTNGVAALYRGIDITIIGSVPLYAINFGLQNQFRESLEYKLGNRPMLNNFLAGGFSMMCALSLVYPSDVIRRHMQLKGKFGVPLYKNWMECSKDIVTKNGVSALYRGLGVDYIKMFPANGIFFVCLDLLKRIEF